MICNAQSRAVNIVEENLSVFFCFFFQQCKLCALPPFFHAYGLAVGIIASIWFGATTILPYSKYSPSKSVSCIIEDK